MAAPLLAALLLSLTVTDEPRAVQDPSEPFLAVVDPGHGGDQDGALGVGGLREKDVALAIARRVAARLRGQGATVLLTRERDERLDLSQRAALANDAEADLFVSIHLNSMPSAAARERTRGVETYFLSADATDPTALAVAARENADRRPWEEDAPGLDPVAGILSDLGDVETLAESSRLAHAVHAAVVLRTGAASLGVKQAPFHVLAGARMPAVLVEVGFVSHREESRLLATPAYQEKVAAAIAEGIASFRGAARQAAR